MKYTLSFLALLAILHVVAAQTVAAAPQTGKIENLDDEIMDVDHFIPSHGFHKFPHKGFPKKHFVHKPKKICFKPTLSVHLLKVLKLFKCSFYKPFGYKIIIVFKTKYYTFTYDIHVCSYKHIITLPKQIFKCSLDLALKKCKYIGLPKCAYHKKFFLGRKTVLGKCLVGVLNTCSKHGKIFLH